MLLYPRFETAGDEGTTWVRVVGCARDKGDKDEDAKYKGDKGRNRDAVERGYMLDGVGRSVDWVRLGYPCAP